MEQTILTTIKEHAMIQPGNHMVVAFSGGADSTSLLHFFVRHRTALGITLSAAHFDHGLRGDESDADHAFVETTCRRWGVPLTSGYGRMSDREMPAKLSTESWARQLRYAFFETLVTDGNTKIATGHNQNDNAETVLFHAIRGSGPAGLAGIPPVRPPYIRPLLAVSRHAIEAYCESHRLPYCTDSTNAELGFSRNRLRHEVFPTLEKVHPGTLPALSRLAEDMREVDRFLSDEAAALLVPQEKLPPDTAAAPLSALENAAPAVRLYALSLMAGRHADRAKLTVMEQLVAKRQGAVQLSARWEARVVGSRLVVQKIAKMARPAPYAYPLESGFFELPGGYTLNISIETSNPTRRTDHANGRKGLTFVADYDKLDRCSTLRNRRAGDTFAPAHRGVTKSLKKWMNEEKIDPARRWQLPLLAENSRVLWVWGEGFCSGVQPTDKTQQYLVIHTN